ncbi:hypothetical protein [Paraburkholderia oxyphila]|uniref:hypothetical protein n=1 Tax=Paraburkholderia oxyphila TaxID=614212 RepID=UPI001FE1C967|nr:hypothetical protein [Paraburkholderia oxyphila]
MSAGMRRSAIIPPPSNRAVLAVPGPCDGVAIVRSPGCMILLNSEFHSPFAAGAQKTFCGHEETTLDSLYAMPRFIDSQKFGSVANKSRLPEASMMLRAPQRYTI